MWCVNPMVVDTWKDPYPGYVECQDGVEGEEDEDKVADHIPVYPPREEASLTRSSSCNRINLALPNRKPKRSLSTSGAHNKTPVRHLAPENCVSSSHLEVEPPKEKEKLKRSNSVLTRLARQYSFSRSRRISSSSSNMNSAQTPEGGENLATKGKSPRRRRNKSTSKKDAKTSSNQNEIKPPSRLGIPETKYGRIPSPLHMTVGNSHINGELASSPDSCPNSPSHFKSAFSVSPPTPPSAKCTENTDDTTINAQRATSPISADESPLPSPPLDDKAYDSGRMSMSSFRSFGSGRPTSLSSVTSSISSRTSRGSDYFSSASSNGQSDQQHQVTSYRLGLQTVLPDLDESDSVDRLVLDTDGDDNRATNSENSGAHTQQNINSRKIDIENSRAAAFAAHDRHNRNDADHLAPVANLAMIVNPDLSYVDRVVLELLETERMYVKSLRDILTGYLSVIRSTPELHIQPTDVDDLFGNIRDIYDFNRNLLVELEACCGNPRRVAECFVAKDGDFKVYTEYCTNYPSSVAAMTRCMRNPNLVDFFKVQQDDLRHTLPLGSYLLKPVQRILKYHLLLQELVKHCDKEEDKEGYQTIQTALQTMTRVARHINEMKRKHEDAVHIQEIQSLLTNWQGNELTTYCELILESEMKMQGARNERQVFLFEKMILITKRREDGYLVCKANIMCANLVLLESLPNTPLGFQIQPFAENAACISNGVQQGNGPQEPSRVQKYILLAPSQEEKSLWIYHIKRLIIETMNAAIPLQAKKSIMRMGPLRDGDRDGDSEEDRMRKKSKARYGSSAILGNQDSKSTKSTLSRLTSTASSTNLGNGGSKKMAAAATAAVQTKTRRRSDSMSRKILHKRALKRKEEVESSDDISTDSAPNTPSGLKVAGKFSFPGFRQSTRSSNVPNASKPTTTQAQSKTPSPKTTNRESKTTKEQNKETSNAPPAQTEVVKRHHNSVIYRRHKRRTSQPITITEKRLSMKASEDGGDDKDQEEDDGENEFDDWMNFNPLKARESVSWDIQIVEAVFDRYKNEATSPISPPSDAGRTPLGSTYLTVPRDVAPSPLISLDHTPILSERRKSRIVVVPSSESSEEEAGKKKAPSVVRRKKDKNGRMTHRTSGVVYTLTQELDVESDSGIDETKAIIRKVAKASESAQKSQVIHESDTGAEASLMLKEKANTVRKKSSLKRRERYANKKTEVEPSPKSRDGRPGGRRGSLYDNLDDVIAASDISKTTVTSSVQCMSTHTISMVDSSTKSTSTMVTVQSSSSASIPSTGLVDVISFNKNSNNNNNNRQMTSPPKGRQITPTKDTMNIPTGKVRGLIERMWNSPPAKSDASGALRRTPVTSPTYSVKKDQFSFEPVIGVTSPIMCSTTSTSSSNLNSNSNNNGNNISVLTTGCRPLILTSSSSDSEDDSRPTIVQRVKKLSMNDREIADDQGEAKRAANPFIFLRRTFSQDESNSNTRHSTNLVLEARMSGEYIAESETGYADVSTGDNAYPGFHKSGQSPLSNNNDFQFGGTVDEPVTDAKHYLFEKLCLTPGESKITDMMSEEFEHVCSDLESSLRLSSLESHAFSTSDEDSVIASRMEKTLRRELSPLIPRREITKFESALTSDQNRRQKKDLPENEQPTNIGAKSPEVDNVSSKSSGKYVRQFSDSSAADSTLESLSEPKIYGTKHTDVTSGLRKYGTQYGRNILPNRSDSIRSTRSEYVPSRSSANQGTESRGRSLTQRSRNSFNKRLPSRDMQAIPQMNVAKLTKQFSEICDVSEKMATCPPRRSKSVEGGARMRHRMQTRKLKEQNKPKDEEKPVRDESPPRQEIRSKSMKDVSRTDNKRTVATRPGRERTKYSIEKASIKVDEMLVCKTVTDSDKQTLAVVTSSNDHNEEDDVFPASPKSPTTAETRAAKKMSFVEMFAANPNKNDEAPQDESVLPQNNESEQLVDNVPTKTQNIGKEDEILKRACQNTSSVRVILVHRPDDVRGQGGLEPRVLNLSHRSKDALLSPPPLEKRHSWTKLTDEKEETPRRTRLRSSSLTRNRRRAILAHDS